MFVTLGTSHTEREELLDRCSSSGVSRVRPCEELLVEGQERLGGPDGPQPPGLTPDWSHL